MYEVITDDLFARVSVVLIRQPCGNFGNINSRCLRLLLGVQGEVTEGEDDSEATNSHSHGAERHFGPLMKYLCRMQPLR